MTRKFALAALCLIATCAMLVPVVSSAVPQEKSEKSETLVLTWAEYKISDCFGENHDCGHIIAKAWCDSKGYAKAASFSLISQPEPVVTATGRSKAAPPSKGRKRLAPAPQVQQRATSQPSVKITCVG
jgi:hypothetical protein